MPEPADKNGVDGLDAMEAEDARRRSAPKAAVVYEAVRQEAEDELRRSTAALMWSGLAAGLSMGFSFLMETGFFRTELNGELIAIGIKVYASHFPATLLSAIFAGWLIALMVWLLPVSETGRVTIIIIITYVVGIGGFAHPTSSPVR
jgi:formate/nitrite transporter FocA (FNT family)